VSADLLDHGVSLLLGLALALAVLGLGVDQLAGGSNDHLEVAGRLRVSDALHFHLAGELVLKRYCEGVEVALHGEKEREGKEVTISGCIFGIGDIVLSRKKIARSSPYNLIHHSTAQ
jgi:hypothetical protein